MKKISVFFLVFSTFSRQKEFHVESMFMTEGIFVETVSKDPRPHYLFVLVHVPS